MALPPSVQAQLDAAEAHLQVVNNPQDPSTTQPVTLEELAQPPAAPPVASNEPPPLAPEPPVSAPPPPAAAEDATWEKRYKTLQGLFNAQVPELQQQVKTLSTQLQDAVNRLNQAAEDKRKPEPPKAPAVEPADVEAFGQDLVDMVNRVAGHAAGNAVSALQSQLADVVNRLSQLEGNVQGTSQMVTATAEERFFDRLVQMVPDWETLNTDPAFLAWLVEVDPIYGAPRKAALGHARQNLDAQRVAAIFNAFKSTLPQAPKPDAVEKQVSPRASAATPTPTPVVKPQITQAQVTRFYDDVRRGAYKDRPDEARRIEQVINEALAEGRVM